MHFEGNTTINAPRDKVWKFLTDPNDLVVDIFSGSNTTGRVCENLGRSWIAMEDRRDYAALSLLRFLEDDLEDTEMADLVAMAEQRSISVPQTARQMTIADEVAKNSKDRDATLVLPAIL